MTLAEALAFLAEQSDAKDVAAALQTAAPKVYQHAFDAGHSTATAASKATIKGLEKERDEHKAARTTAEERLAEAQRTQPDVAKLRADHDAVVAELKEKHKNEVKALKDAGKERDRKATLADLKLAMVEAGIDPEYADLRVGALVDRLDVADDGTITVRQLEKDTPYSGKDTKENLKLLAADVKAGIKNPHFLTGKGDTGAGATGGPSGGPKGDAALYQGMREMAAKFNGQTPAPANGGTPAPRPPSLEERMNMATRR